MSRPVLVLRPEPGNARTMAAAIALGLNAVPLPLFAVEPVAWEPPDSAAYTAVLLTSAYASRCGGDALRRYHHLPTYTVGAETARAANAAGFTVVAQGSSGVAGIVARMPEQGRVLYLCGADVTPFESALPVDQLTVYESVAQRPDGLADWLGKNLIALLHSPRAAAHFASLVDDRRHIALAAFSQSVADSAGNGWESLAIAANPRDEDLLAVALQLA